MSTHEATTASPPALNSPHARIAMCWALAIAGAISALSASYAPFMMMAQDVCWEDTFACSVAGARLLMAPTFTGLAVCIALTVLGSLMRRITGRPWWIAYVVICGVQVLAIATSFSLAHSLTA